MLIYMIKKFPVMDCTVNLFYTRIIKFIIAFSASQTGSVTPD